MAEQDAQQQVVELIRDAGVAMMTYVDPDGSLVSKPMATQETEFDGTIRFIAERSSEKAQALMGDPRVNVSYAGKGSWVSVAGQARIVDDEAKLKELWGSFTGAWLEGGPDNPENILIEVDADTAEYWSAPGGSTVTSLANLVKAKVTGETVDGDNKTVELG